MKKQSVILMGIVLVALSYFNEVALSMIKVEKWTNYIQYWQTKSKAVKLKPAEKIRKQHVLHLEKRENKYVESI